MLTAKEFEEVLSRNPKPPRKEVPMWTTREFEKVLSHHPKGGTFWTGIRGCVRFIRVFRDGDTLVAVVTEHTQCHRTHDSSVSLYVRDRRGSWVDHFWDPAKTKEFTKRLLQAPALLWVRARLRPTARDFVSRPPRAIAPELFPLW